jgi:hypothetical protein
MFRTIIRRDGNNPLTGRAQYRVVDCYQSMMIVKSAYLLHGKLHLIVDAFHQPNSFINPRKALGI